MNSNFKSIAMTSFRAFALGFSLLVFGHSAAFAAAGKIQFTAGEVKIVNAQQAERVAQKGEALESGDTIVTGAGGSVQVALADGGLIAVRPNSQLKIDDYAYSGKADDSKNKSFFSLGKGTFRSITGAIGQNNKQAYRVNTPTATMGIRGTDHEPAVVPQLPPLPPDVLQALTLLQLAPPGTYDRVNSGATFLQTPEGLVFLGPNQVGFAPAGGGPPIVLPNVPGFYTNTPKTNPAKAAADAKKSASASGGAGSTSTSSTTSESTASSENTGTAVTSETVTTIATSPVADPSVAISQIATTNTTLIAAASGTLGTPAPLGSGLVGTFVDSNPQGTGGAGGIYLENPPLFSQEILVGAQKEVLRIFDGSSPTFEFLSNNSSLSDQGTFTFSDGGRVDWGRWAPGYSILENGAPVTTTVGDFQYVFSQDITSLDLVRNASGGLVGGLYGYVGGPRPTDFNGVIGDILPGNTFLNVNFTLQSVTLNVGTSINGVTLIGSASGAIIDFIDPNSAIISTISEQMANGTIVIANGFFIGPTAAGAIASFDILDGASSNAATGTVVLDRNTPPPLAF